MNIARRQPVEERPARTRRGSAVEALAVAPLIVAGLALIETVVRPRSGLPGLAAVLEVQLVVAALVVLAPLTVVSRSRRVAKSFGVAIAVAALLFGSDWVSLPRSARVDISVMTWNLQYTLRTPEGAVAAIRAARADIVALQELTPAVAAAIDADREIAQHFPYRFLVPAAGPVGLGVVSRYPISNTQAYPDAALIQMAVATPRGAMELFDGHPLPGTIETATSFDIPVDYDPTARDAAIDGIRRHIDAAIDGRRRVMVVGDYNASPTEASYRALTRGLHDLHVDVGDGPGWTWRPSRFAFLPFGLVRIDLQLAASIEPVWTSIDCTHGGDHCQLYGGYQFP